MKPLKIVAFDDRVAHNIRNQKISLTIAGYLLHLTNIKGMFFVLVFRLQPQTSPSLCHIRQLHLPQFIPHQNTSTLTQKCCTKSQQEAWEICVLHQPPRHPAVSNRKFSISGAWITLQPGAIVRSIMSTKRQQSAIPHSSASISDANQNGGSIRDLT